MIFCPNNLITASNATINGSVESFPIDNMLSDRLNERTFFTDYIVIDLGSAVLIDTLAVAYADKSITIEANSSDSWGAPPFSQSMTLISGTDISLKFISQTYRYWRITASGDTKIGHAFIGNKLLLPDPKYGSIPVFDDTDIESISIGGQRYTTNGIRIKNQGFQFSFKSKEEYDIIKEFSVSSYRNKSGIFAQTELNLDLFNPYFARILITFNDRNTSERYNFSAEVQEMK
jgi:hypothetical protein